MSNHGYGSLHLTLKTKSSEKEGNANAHSSSTKVPEAVASSVKTPAEVSSASTVGHQQPSRKRKRTEDAGANLNDSCEVTGETIVLNETATVEKPPKPKKRKVADAGSSKSVPTSLTEPQAGPSGANVLSESQGTHNVSHDASMTEQLDDRGRHMFVDPTSASLCYEDITEDDEIWVVQCPKFINPERLIGNTINLREKCEMKCTKEDGSKIKLDSYPVKTEAGASKINLILPSQDEVLKIKVANLQGKLILTEQVSVPEIDYEAIMNTPKEEISFPTNLKVRHPLLGLDIPDGPTVPLKAKRKGAKRMSMPSKVNSAPVVEDGLVMSQDLFAGCQEDSYNLPAKKSKNRQNHSQTAVAAGGISFTENEYLTEPAEGHQDATPTRSKKKKKRHLEESSCNLEIKSEIPSNESDNYYDVSFSNSKREGIHSVRDSDPANVESYLDRRFNSTISHPTSTPKAHVEDISSTKSKKKNKKPAEAPLTEINNSSRDPLEMSNYLVDGSFSTSKKKKKRSKAAVHDTASSDSEIKREPVDPLDLGADCPMDNCESEAKKKKKSHSETACNDSETFNEEFKSEPGDFFDLERAHSVDKSVSKSKKKKKKDGERTLNSKEDSKIPDVEFKYEPKDPLDLGPDHVMDNSFSTSKKKKKKHEGIRLSDTVVLPVIVKNEPNDSQDSSFEQGDLSSVKAKKKKKLDKTKMSDTENPVLVEENQYNSSLIDFNPSQNNESFTKSKRKKKHSLVTSVTSEISSAEVGSFNQSVLKNVDSVSVKSKKKKKRKSGLDDGANELMDTSMIKVENDAESNFNVFNSSTSNYLPSFLDTLSSNYEFSVPNSSVTKKKKKKSKKSGEE